MDDEVEPTPEEVEAIRLAREESGVILHEDLMRELALNESRLAPKWATQFITVEGRVVDTETAD